MWVERWARAAWKEDREAGIQTILHPERLWGPSQCLVTAVHPEPGMVPGTQQTINQYLLRALTWSQPTWLYSGATGPNLQRSPGLLGVPRGEQGIGQLGRHGMGASKTHMEEMAGSEHLSVDYTLLGLTQG